MTIHADTQATADRWRESGRFVLFGEGEYRPVGTTELIPPAAFVEAAKVCEHCLTLSGSAAVQERLTAVCDCSNGRPRHPVTVPCTRNDCERGVMWDDMGAKCRYCEGGRITTDLLAIVEFGPVPVKDAWTGFDPSNAVAVLIDGRPGVEVLPAGTEFAHLPGQWAIGGSIEVAS